MDKQIFGLCCRRWHNASIWFACSCFLSHNCLGEWEGGPVKQVNNTSWIDVVNPICRPKLVHNLCVFELFDGVFVLPLCFLNILLVSGRLSYEWVRSLPFSLYG